MSVLTELNDKWERGELKDPTPLQELLLYEDSKYHEAAAAELAAKDAEIAKLKAEIKNLISLVYACNEDDPWIVEKNNGEEITANAIAALQETK